jgi:hypothetical protein
MDNLITFCKKHQSRRLDQSDDAVNCYLVIWANRQIGR